MTEEEVKELIKAQVSEFSTEIQTILKDALTATADGVKGSIIKKVIPAAIAEALKPLQASLADSQEAAKLAQEGFEAKLAELIAKPASIDTPLDQSGNPAIQKLIAELADSKKREEVQLQVHKDLERRQKSLEKTQAETLASSVKIELQRAVQARKMYLSDTIDQMLKNEETPLALRQGASKADLMELLIVNGGLGEEGDQYVITAPDPYDASAVINLPLAESLRDVVIKKYPYLIAADVTGSGSGAAPATRPPGGNKAVQPQFFSEGSDDQTLLRAMKTDPNKVYNEIRSLTST